MRRTCLAAAAAVLILGIAAGCSGESQTPAAEEKPLSTRLEEASQVFRNRRYDEAGELFESVAADALAAENQETFTQAASMRARSFLAAGDAERAQVWIERAADYADTSAPLGWSSYLGARGRIERQSGDNETAARTFRELYDYSSRNELFERAVDAAHMVAMTGTPEEKLEWAHRGIEMAEEGGLVGWLGPLWNNLGWDYVDAGRYEEGLEALEKAREYHYLGTAPIPKLIADYSVAHVLRLKGELDVAKEALREVFARANELHEEGNPDALEWIGFSRWELGEIEIAQGDTAAGLEMLREALEELEDAGMPVWDEDDWQSRRDRVAELEGS